MDMRHVELFRALADETRQEILELLRQHERNVNDICGEFEHMTQPTISHHLQILSRTNVVVRRRKGKMIFYSINKKVLRDGVEGFIHKFEIQVL